MNTNDPRWELIRSCRDGEATHEELTKLENLLREDVEFRLAYLRYANVSLTLETTALSESADPPMKTRIVRWMSRPWLSAAAAFALLAVVAGLVLGKRGPAQAPEYIATLTLAAQCEWDGAESFIEGQRMAAGPLRLRSGTAMMRFDAGASVLMTGAAEMELKSRSRALLRAGEVMVRAEEQAAGFLLETPASQVTDLGTEFAVKVESSGATEVHVLEGLVSYRKPESTSDAAHASEALLAAGRAVRYDTPSQDAPREVNLLPSRFEEAVNAALASRKDVALLAHEPFAYAADVLPVHQARGGIGWLEAWQPARTWPASDNPFRPLRFIATSALTHGRLLDASDAFPQISRKLASPIRLDRDGVYYLSARVRWVPGISPVKYMRQARIILRSSADPRRARYVLNMPTCLRPQIQRHDLEVFTSRAKVEAGDVQRWVLKIIAREHGMDELHFRVFQEHEPPGPTEPLEWHLSLTQERSEAWLDQLVLDTYLAPDPVAFGDLRLGTTWRAVTR